MSNPDPTNCNRCGATLDRGHVQKGKIINDEIKITETICFQCDKLETWKVGVVDEIVSTLVLQAARIRLEAMGKLNPENIKPA